MSNPFPPLGTPLASLGLALSMQEMDARRAQDTRVAELELQLRRARSDLARLATTQAAWKALVVAMVHEQRDCESGARWTRDLTDGANDVGRAKFLREAADTLARRAAKGVR